ncbi:MAG: ABC transporter ATP-binding protein [Desulfohalobiaceae bacterium]|nr:ABC transporter ATP-binding protein [Desulfohalobiaceae bacterium]
MKPLLTINNLVTSFHSQEQTVRAVDGLDVSVRQGETLGLVGESGCGKSVTALSVLRLLRCPPAEIRGSIVFNGRNLLDLSREEMRRLRGDALSMVFQEPMTSLNPVLTIDDQLTEGIRLHRGASRAKAREMALEFLDMVRIPDARNRIREYPHALSGGMRQRVMIAMALSCHPELLFADEPTTALDVTIQAQILELLAQLKDELGTSVVMITHDLGVIAEMASRVVVMYAGRVVEEAPVRDLFKDPRHPYTRGLLGSIPVLGRRKSQKDRKLQEIPGIVPDLKNLPSGCRFHPRCPQKMDVCERQDPAMIRLGEFRAVTCWLEAEV